MIKLFYFVILLVLTGCISSSKKIPKGIMSEEQMVAYLIDLQLADAKISTLNLPEDSIMKFYDKLELELFKKHNITDSLYIKSVSYYLYDVKGMEDIYSAVVDSLSLRERLQNTN
jgi:hypothetical protein